ncbi:MULTISPECIES: sulfatase family protein [Clostridium]|uniref:sulfatase family protein n=1 Tax=Clostridium TaxID=1485 RepID=UPI000825F813|nr:MULTISPECIES: sulfatase [Clostridium]PJI07331.1 hypothetical protein CUB90_05395 [Clostridium sp. CT7]
MNKKNVLFLVADDSNYNSLGAFGCPVENITPNLDKLACNGIRFENAHVTVAICQPSRQCLLTGLYPYNNGAPGFDPINSNVTTLTEVLKSSGYMNGIIGKIKHCKPIEKFAWDWISDTFNSENLYGRSPDIYYKNCKSFFEKAKDQNKPFFLMANSHDPHRPFAGSADELKQFGFNIYASRYYTPEEIDIPGFLPDISAVRKEVAQYFSSMHRCDETMGMIMKALKETGMDKDTLIVFLSDNGMAFPFAKTNCYLNSTKTPLIFSMPGIIKEGSVDNKHFVAGIDFMPTILDFIDISYDGKVDGKSYKSLLLGEDEGEWNEVYTQITKNSGGTYFPMRCIQDHKYGYIFNDWSDGKTKFKNESMNGLTYKGMVDAAADNPEIEERVKMFLYRSKEELYDFAKDPDALKNLIDNPEYQSIRNQYRDKMLSYMKKTGDPYLDEFCKILNK